MRRKAFLFIVLLITSFSAALGQISHIDGADSVGVDKWKIRRCDMYLDSVCVNLIGFDSHIETLSLEDTFSLELYIENQNTLYHKKVYCSVDSVTNHLGKKIDIGGRLDSVWNASANNDWGETFYEFYSWRKEACSFCSFFFFLGDLPDEFNLVAVYRDQNILADTAVLQFSVDNIHPTLHVDPICPGQPIHAYISDMDSMYSCSWNVANKGKQNNEENHITFDDFVDISESKDVRISCSVWHDFCRKYLDTTVTVLPKLRYELHGFPTDVCSGGHTFCDVYVKNGDANLYSWSWFVEGEALIDEHSHLLELRTENFYKDREGGTLQVEVQVVDEKCPVEKSSLLFNVIPTPQITVEGNMRLACGEDSLVLIGKVENEGFGSYNYSWTNFDKVFSSENRVMFERENMPTSLYLRVDDERGCGNQEHILLEKESPCEMDTIFLTVKDGANGRMDFLIGECKTQKIRIVPETGWVVGALSFNGDDVTNQLQDGFYETPAVMENSTLSVVYKKITLTNAPSPAYSLLRVWTNNDNIIIRNAQAGSNITVSNMLGSIVYSGKVDSSDMSININGEGIFLVDIDGEIFKISL